jgi:hypothetical protein
MQLIFLLLQIMLHVKGICTMVLYDRRFIHGKNHAKLSYRQLVSIIAFYGKKIQANVHYR